MIQVGAEDRKKLIVAVILMILAVVLLGRWLFSMTESSSSAATTAPPNVAPAAPASPVPSSARRAGRTRGNGVKPAAAQSQSLDPSLRYDWLKGSENTEYKGSGRNIFLAQIEIPKPKRVIVPMPPPAPVQPSGPPPPPPIDLKFFGFASKPGEPKKVFLSKGGDVFIAGEADIVDSRYRVLRISPMAVEIEDVLNNNRQEIPLSAQ